MSIPQRWGAGRVASNPGVLWYKKVLHRDPEYMQGKLGFPGGFGVISDLWIPKAVLEHFSCHLITFRRLLSGSLPIGSFTNIPA